MVPLSETSALTTLSPPGLKMLPLTDNSKNVKCLLQFSSTDSDTLRGGKTDEVTLFSFECDDVIMGGGRTETLAEAERASTGSLSG